MRRQPGGLILKDPEATADPWGFDYTAYLAELGTGITVTASTWAITGPDNALTVVGSSIVTLGLKTQVKLTGGTLGARYVVTNSIVTSAGNGDDRSFRVLIQGL